MKTLLLAVGWIIGLFSAAAFGFFTIGLVLYVADGDGMVAVAYIPKWIFPFSLLLLLGRTEELREFVVRIDEHFDQELQEAERARQEAASKEWRW